MTFPNEPIQSPEPHPESRISARARRRRARRTFFPKDVEGRAVVIASLAKRAYPSYELFIYSILCGTVLGVGYILDSYGVLVLGILLAPLMAPWFGLILSTISGMPRLFFQTAIGVLISAILVFGTSTLAGLASRLVLPHTFNAAFVLSRLWWPELIILALGAVLLTASFVRSESKPYLPSVVVAYGLFMPLSASGFGVGNGIGDLWPHGALVFVVHLAWASIFGLLTLVILRFRPLSPIRYSFSLGVFVIFILTVFWLTDPSKAQTTGQTAGLTPLAATSTPVPLLSETLAPTALPSATIILLRPTETESASPESPEATSATTDETITPIPVTLNVTLPVTETRTSTPAPEPTPIYAVIRAREGGGAYIRKDPGGNVIATLDNGSIVQILPETQDKNGVLWIHIAATRNDIHVEGWIIQSVLETATPVPNWEPSETPTPTP